MITQIELKQIISYEKHSGNFTWKKPSKYHSEKKGMAAGCISNSRGKDYIVIRIGGKGYKAHRLAWLYVYGYFPRIIDHINGDSKDNRISNLRDTTSCVNNQNHIRKTRECGLPQGVSTTHNGRYRARITVEKNVIQLGTFTTPSEAGDVYADAKAKMHDAPARSELNGIL